MDRRQLALALKPRDPTPSPAIQNTSGLVEAPGAQTADTAVGQGGGHARKITADLLARSPIVYGWRSIMAQVIGNLESQRRQHDLAGPPARRAPSP